MQGVSRRCSEAPLKLASRSVVVYFFGCWVLGVGRWVLGVFWVLGALGRRRRGLRTGYFAGGLCTLFRSTSELGVAIRGGLFFGCWVLGVGCWVLGVGCWARQGRPRVRRLKGRWVALSPPVSRRPGWYTSPRPRRRPSPRRRPRPRRRRSQRGGVREPRAAAYPLNTPRGPNGVPTPSI